MTHYKYPRTPHLPFSPGIEDGDVIFNGSFQRRHVVITMKMDGANTTMYRDGIHGRSLDSPRKPHMHWVMGFHAGLAYRIPEGIRLCGENLYATHSIKYKGLPSYFLLHSAWKGEICLPWSDTVALAQELGLDTVPVLFEGLYIEKDVKRLIRTLDLEKDEGVVVRRSGSFFLPEFSSNAAKWVRPNHSAKKSTWTGEEKNELQ